MKNQFYSTLIVLLIFTIGAIGQNETIFFDVIHNGKTIGSLKAEKTLDNNKISYASSTILEFYIITKIEIVYNYKVIYIDDVLDDATVNIKVHGHVKTDVKTEKEKEKYIYYSDNKKVKEFIEDINFSIEKMFFVEPVNAKRVYAEEHGEFHELKKVEAHKYLKTTPSGNESTYYYNNGSLIKAEIDAGIIAFSIELKK